MFSCRKFVISHVMVCLEGSTSLLYSFGLPTVLSLRLIKVALKQWIKCSINGSMNRQWFLSVSQISCCFFCFWIGTFWTLFGLLVAQHYNESPGSLGTYRVHFSLYYNFFLNNCLMFLLSHCPTMLSLSETLANVICSASSDVHF